MAAEGRAIFEFLVSGRETTKRQSKCLCARCYDSDWFLGERGSFFRLGFFSLFHA